MVGAELDLSLAKMQRVKSNNYLTYTSEVGGGNRPLFGKNAESEEQRLLISVKEIIRCHCGTENITRTKMVIQ